MNKLILSCTIVSFLFLIACSEQKTEETKTSATENNLAIVQLKSLDDSCAKAWTMMVSSDDQKIKDIQRLIQEISYIPSHNEKLVEKLSGQTKELASLRYTQEDLNSDKINAYDAATDSLLKAVFELKRNTKGVENYTLTEELEQSIRAADGSVVNYRVLYDVWVKKFNASLEAAKTSEFKKKTTFEII